MDVPVELATLLDADRAARKSFESLSFSHRREHAMFVAEAKKPETRQRRAQRTVDGLVK